MDVQQAGLVELIQPEGGRVLVGFREDVIQGPELEAAVVRLLFDIEGTDGEICDALTGYAQASGLAAHFFVGRESLIVELSQPSAGRAHGSS